MRKPTCSFSISCISWTPGTRWFSALSLEITLLYTTGFSSTLSDGISFSELSSADLFALVFGACTTNSFYGMFTKSKNKIAGSSTSSFTEETNFTNREWNWRRSHIGIDGIVGRHENRHVGSLQYGFLDVRAHHFCEFRRSKIFRRFTQRFNVDWNPIKSRFQITHPISPSYKYFGWDRMWNSNNFPSIIRVENYTHRE